MVSITCPFTLRVKFQWINNYPTLNTTQHFVYHWDQIPFPMFTFFNKFYSWWCWKQWQCDAYGWEIVKLFTQLLRNITNRVSNVFKVCISVHQNSRAHSIMSMTKPWPSSWPSSKPSSGSSLKTQVEHYKRLRTLSTSSQRTRTWQTYSISDTTAVFPITVDDLKLQPVSCHIVQRCLQRKKAHNSKHHSNNIRCCKRNCGENWYYDSNIIHYNTHTAVENYKSDSILNTTTEKHYSGNWKWSLEVRYTAVVKVVAVINNIFSLDMKIDSCPKMVYSIKVLSLL